MQNCRSWHDDEGKCTFILLQHGAMVGDVNLFLGVEDDRTAAEIEVMVAEPGARRGGCACEAVRHIQTWAWGRLGVRRFVAKIGCDNAASLALFRKLGYTHVSTSAVFQEDTLELVLGGGDSEREAFNRLRISSVPDDDPLGVTAPV
jgi:RimJ/RimL family protein N-acetyltransferase